MKKILFATIAMIMLCLSACTGLQQGTSLFGGVIFYTDSEPLETNQITIQLETPYCYGIGNSYSLSVRLEVTNKEYKTRDFRITNAKLIKESTSATYTLQCKEEEFSIEAEMSKSFSFTANIPSDIKADEYKLSFKLNTMQVTVYLYETPDSLREDHTVNYYVEDNLVYSITVKDKRTLGRSYVYDSADHLSYCSTWYAKGTREEVIASTVITADMDLTGTTTSNFKWSGLSTDAYSYVSGVNHIPSDGIIRLPERYNNKELAIGMYAIKGVSNAIYIPKTVRSISLGNFSSGQGTIYYEGNESEWAALFPSASYVVTRNVVYNTTYPNRGQSNGFIDDDDI